LSNVGPSVYVVNGCLLRVESIPEATVAHKPSRG
jgi:hypothetical protein